MEPTRHILYVTWPPGVRPSRPDARPAERPDGTAEATWTYQDAGYARQWAEYYRDMGATVRVVPSF